VMAYFNISLSTRNWDRAKKKIVEMAFNGSGVGTTARIRYIGIYIVPRVLKKSHQGK
jgi:transposase-like protein